MLHCIHVCYFVYDSCLLLVLKSSLKTSAVVEDRFLCRHVGSNFNPIATIVDKTMVRK